MAYDRLKGVIVQIDISPGARLDWRVGSEKRCTGRFGENGYEPCKSGLPPRSGFSACQNCSSFPLQECAFNPRCDGELCDHPACGGMHDVYLAFYGDMVKVGMTRSERLPTRVVEQGADAYCRVATYGSRRLARNAELCIASLTGAAERIPSKYFLSSLANLPNRNAIAANHGRCEGLIGDMLGIDISAPKLLDGYPLRQPLWQIPALKATCGAYSGESLGAKGPYLVYRGYFGLDAVRLSDLAGRTVLV
ncbi:MAG: hypothetical protein CVT48_04580 [Thermoplasmata archaeon HGW-Thermoplasmata-1]|nr:MAG: hypothetical protein CVT48_04580 [Thermoplasmata archaeon HGW-Thermoplasmata-1]